MMGQAKMSNRPRILFSTGPVTTNGAHPDPSQVSCEKCRCSRTQSPAAIGEVGAGAGVEIALGRKGLRKQHVVRGQFDVEIRGGVCRYWSDRATVDPGA